MPNLNQYHDALGPTRHRLNANRHKVFALPAALVCRSVFLNYFLYGRWLSLKRSSAQIGV